MKNKNKNRIAKNPKKKEPPEMTWQWITWQWLGMAVHLKWSSYFDQITNQSDDSSTLKKTQKITQNQRQNE